MLEVEMRVHNQDEIEVSVYAYDLDPDITYEVNMILEDSDGNFQDYDDMVIMNSYDE